MTGQPAPEEMTGGTAVTFVSYEYVHDPADPVGRAIMAAGKAVFPQHGLPS